MAGRSSETSERALDAFLLHFAHTLCLPCMTGLPFLSGEELQESYAAAEDDRTALATFCGMEGREGVEKIFQTSRKTSALPIRGRMLLILRR